MEIMRLNLAVLPKMFYKPKEAFQELEGVTMAEGIVMALILISLGGVIDVCLQLGIAGTIISMIAGFLSILFSAFLSANLAEVLGGKRDYDKTVGFFGYAHVIWFVYWASARTVTGLMAGKGMTGVITLPSIVLSISEAAKETTMNLVFPVFQITLCLMLFLSVIIPFYSFKVYGLAIARANNISFKKGVLVWLAAALVTGLTMVPVKFFFMSLFSMIT